MPEPVDLIPYKPTYNNEDIPVEINERNEVPTKEFDSYNFIRCGGVVGFVVTGLFIVGECDL